MKQLYKIQSELAVAHKQQLASTHAVDEARDLIAVLKADKECLQAEVDELCGILLGKLSRDCKAESITTNLGRLSLTKTETSAEEVGTGSVTSKPCHLPTMKH